MTTIKPWDDVGMCYRNATILKKVNMPAAASIWEARAEVLMGQITGRTTGVTSMMEELLRGARPAGNA